MNTKGWRWFKLSLNLVGGLLLFLVVWDVLSSGIDATLNAGQRRHWWAIVLMLAGVWLVIKVMQWYPRVSLWWHHKEIEAIIARQKDPKETVTTNVLN